MPGHWLVGDTRPDPDARRAAVLLAVTGGDTSGDETSIAELARLAGTDGLDVVGEVTQARPHPDPTTFIGAGKVDELTALVRDRNAAVVIADAELSPAQIRNLEDRTGVRVVDRTALILDVFARHAQSREGRAQVELAQLASQLPAAARPGAADVAGGWWPCRRRRRHGGVRGPGSSGSSPNGAGSGRAWPTCEVSSVRWPDVAK